MAESSFDVYYLVASLSQALTNDRPVAAIDRSMNTVR
jgi:hypothetical protein